MFERIICILIKEFKQTFRDPRMRFTILIAPLIQVLIFGYAANTDVKHVPTAIYDLDNTPQTREIIRRFDFSEYFNVKHYIYDDEYQKYLIDNSSVNAVIRFNKGFTKDLVGGKSAQMQLILDGTDSNTASIVLNYANAVMQRYSYPIMLNRANVILAGRNKFPQVDLRSRAWFNENLESINYFIPGVIALLITVTTLMLTAMAIVREKEIGTMEQLIVSPVKPVELIMGKVLPFAIIAFVDLIFVTILAVAWFKVPIRGNIILLMASTALYLLVTLGIGLFISTISSTQQEATMATFLFIFPTNLLSGFTFPIYNMPDIVQYMTYFIPLRYYLVILRGIFLKGVGVDILWPQMAVLFVMGVIILTLSSLRFRKNLG